MLEISFKIALVPPNVFIIIFYKDEDIRLKYAKKTLYRVGFNTLK